MARITGKTNYTASEQKIIKILKNNGFDEEEAVVYMAGLKTGPASVWEISNASGIKRPTCYLILDDLVAKGFASKTFDSRRTIYTVISALELFQQFKNNLDSMEQSISEFEALSSESQSKPQVRLFEGEDGVRQAYEYTLKVPQKGEILIYGNPEVLHNYPQMIELYLKRRVARNIYARAILPEGPTIKEISLRDDKEMRKTRILPKEKFEQMTEVNILPNAIIYIAHSETKPFATIIESTTLAQEEKNRFELLWNIAKPVS